MSFTYYAVRDDFNAVLDPSKVKSEGIKLENRAAINPFITANPDYRIIQLLSTK